ncbi:MAG: glycoside hydrolase family 5 [Lacunisphaera sp.]|nr:glycoside hydrolase family 5 [Lacunisphaera sp.]
MKRFAAWLLAGLVAGPLGAQDVRVRGVEFVKPDGQVLHLKGTSLGNWLVPEGYMWRFKGGPQSPREIEALVELLLGPDKAAAFWQEYRNRYVTAADINFLARSGCNTLRVPLHYRFFLEEKGEGFRLLDRVVEWSRAAGLFLILDLHCAPGGQTGTNIDDSRGYPWLFESPSAEQQLMTVWRNLARHYRHEPAILGYDLLNEPLPAFAGWEKYRPLVEPLLQRVTETVRAVDPNHIVFVTGVNWDSDFKLLGAPFAPNLAYTFHKYWMPPTVDSIREYLDFREKYQVPIWIGETGENKDEWIAAFRALLEEHDIGWTFWPYKKMESTACFVQFAPPAHWAEIVAFAKLSPGTGTDQVKANLATRPSPAVIEECFTDLLRQIEFSHATPNRGYIEALGLSVPQ